MQYYTPSSLLNNLCNNPLQKNVLVYITVVVLPYSSLVFHVTKCSLCNLLNHIPPRTHTIYVHLHNMNSVVYNCMYNFFILTPVRHYVYVPYIDYYQVRGG